MSRILAVTTKELKTYFGTPMAAIFIGAFLLCSLFSFFWIETFYARNIADIRPLFRWMPLLMIFLSAALTMRQWSEEQKMGTLEVLLTLPVRIHQLVLGKFLAVLILTTIALFLTFGLPISVSLMGNLDWGPVIGGYVGALLMTCTYISIGLFISSRTDSQIISLMLTVMVAGFFYLLGTSPVADLLGNRGADLLRSFGTGSRFISIERGVFDLRDIVYYLSLTIFFLCLNIYFLDRQRWSFTQGTAAYRQKALIAVILIGLNLLAANMWLSKLTSARLDLTNDKEYSLSPATLDLIGNLNEPLMIRGYFSAKTHPLLSPLVPRIQDMITEYQIASKGSITASFVDPKFDEEVESEANRQFGIKPVPFQVAGRYESAVVNSYFDVLIKYGDQYVTLGFNDLIEAKPRPDGQLDVSLRNLEYDLTKSIKKVVYGFQSLASVFEKNPDKFRLINIISPENLPEPFKELPGLITHVVQDLQKESGGKLGFDIIDLDNQPADALSINEQFGIEPIQASFFSDDRFYLHLLLETDDLTERIYLTPDMGEAEIRQEVEGALKRSGSGFTKTIGIWTPPVDAAAQLGMISHSPEGKNYQIVKQLLHENYNLKEVDLHSARVSGDIDMLILVAPRDMSDVERLAIDQYLMRGGIVVALASNYLLDLSPRAETLQVEYLENTIAELLNHYGVTVGDSLVLDRQNEPFPIPVSCDIGGIVIQEIQRIDYPFFIDVRPENMAQGNPITENLPAITMNWTSPLFLNDAVLNEKDVSVLLKSSPESWLEETPVIEPDFDTFPQSGFREESNLAQHNLAIAVTGVFSSFFSDKPDPRLAKKEPADSGEIIESSIPPTISDQEEGQLLVPIIKKSPSNSRLVVIGSAEFISDTVISMSQGLGMDRFLNSLEFMQNVIDWSLADEDLLTIRSRGSHARLLRPMSRKEQRFWEWTNYGFALALLLFVSLFGAARRRREAPIELFVKE